MTSICEPDHVFSAWNRECSGAEGVNVEEGSLCNVFFEFCGVFEGVGGRCDLQKLVEVFGERVVVNCFG